MACIRKALVSMVPIKASPSSNFPARDVLCELACIGDLPLPQPSPPSMKREREWDSPPSSNASELSSSPMSQNETSTRVIAGSRRVRKEPSFINHGQLHLPRHRQPQAASPLSTMRQSDIPLPTSQQASSRSRSHSQIRPQESHQTTSTTWSSNNTDLNVFALPVYSNDLGRLPLHGQMTFGAQAQLSQPQTDPHPQHPEPGYWYTPSQPTSHADANSSYGPHYPPAPVRQQQPYPQSLPGGELPPASGASSVAQGPYGTDPAELATGMLFDAMLGRTGRTQQRTSTYGLGPKHSSIPGMGPGSIVSGPMASTPLQSSSGSSLEEAYTMIGIETMPDHSSGHSQHQHQGAPRQQEQQPLPYPFLDNDAEAIWLNAPTGSQCVIVILFSGYNVVDLLPSFSPLQNGSVGYISHEHY